MEAGNSRSELDGRVEYFDYLRALAIIPVMMVHYRSEILPGGGLGVNIFFCISGYFIAKLLMIEKPPVTAYATFIVRRMCRILPMYYLVLTGMVVLLGIVGPKWREEARHLWDAYFMLGVPSLEPFRTGFLWTLQVEFWFYVLIPLLFIGLRSNRARYLGLGVIAALSVWASSTNSTLVSGNLAPALRDLVFFASNFAFGCMAAILLASGFRLASQWTSSAIAVLSMAIILWCFTEIGIDEVGRPQFRLYGALVALATAALVCCYASKIVRVLWLPGVAAIGVISYSLYLLHLPIQDVLHPLSRDHSLVDRAFDLPLDGIRHGLAIHRSLEPFDVLKFYLFCTAAAAVTYFVVERPSQQFGRRLAKWVEWKLQAPGRVGAEVSRWAAQARKR